MNVYDIAHDLARALKQTSEYKEYKKALDSLNEDPQAKKMLTDFRTKQIEVETLKISKKPFEEEEKKLQNLYSIISHNPLLQKYMAAEHQLAIMMTDIHEILAKAIEID